MTRTARILDQLGWPQQRLAAWLGCSQSKVSRMAGGEPEQGPVSRLLDRLEQEIESGDFRPPSPGTHTESEAAQ